MVQVKKQARDANEEERKSKCIDNKQLIDTIHENKENIIQITTLISKAQNTVSAIQNSSENNILNIIEMIKDVKKANEEEILLNAKSINETNKLIDKLQSAQERIITILTTLMHKYMDT